MEQSMLTIEAFAHYMRGAITLFFVFWCFKLYMYNRRNAHRRPQTDVGSGGDERLQFSLHLQSLFCQGEGSESQELLFVKRY